MSDVILLGEHRSASQRREHALRVQLDFYQRATAAFVVREGGTFLMPREALDASCTLGLSNKGAEGVQMTILPAAPEETAQQPTPVTVPPRTPRVLDDDHLRQLTIEAFGHVPAWVRTEGYTPVAYRRPTLGEYFYDPVRRSVIKCAEDIETQAFVILTYDPMPAPKPEEAPA